MQELEMWCLLGVGRLTALANHAGISKQAMSKKVKLKSNDTNLKYVAEIEAIEMFSEKDAQNNVLKAAKYMVSNDAKLANYAFKQFQKWGRIYGSLVSGETPDSEVFDRNVDFVQRSRMASDLLSGLTKSNRINICEIMGFSKEKGYSIRSGRTAPSWDELNSMKEKISFLWPKDERP